MYIYIYMYIHKYIFAIKIPIQNMAASAPTIGHSFLVFLKSIDNLQKSKIGRS